MATAAGQAATSRRFELPVEASDRSLRIALIAAITALISFAVVSVLSYGKSYLAEPVDLWWNDLMLSQRTDVGLVVAWIPAVVGGPIWAIKGAFPASGALANVATAIVGIDTAADEPNGYPIWVQPFVSGINVGAPKKMDFLGTATWTAAETNLGPFGCLVTDLMLGTGVAVYNSPLGFSLQDVPALWDDTPAGDSLVAAIDTALQSAVNSVVSNPQVDGVLNQILALLPLG